MQHETPTEAELRQAVLDAVKRYYDATHGVQKTFTPGDRVSYGGRVFDEREIMASVEASLDFWLTAGPYARRFEKGLARYLGIRNVALVNSGSSANLLAFTALTSPRLGDRRILPGDEVITIAVTFPTTVAPIIQYGAVPVFVDVTLPSYNIDPTMLEAALSPRTRAVFVAHTLGNPFDVKAVLEFCRAHDLWLIEDNCDSLGSRYCLDGEWKYTGTFGSFGTSSFFPAHHLTMGEGGAIYTDSPALLRIVESLRDWGRDCWCEPGKDNTCGKRFNHQFGELPQGYDHKYVYSHFGYNLKLTDLQAAIGCMQLEKLEQFNEARRRNWQTLRSGLAPLAHRFLLPEGTPNADPSWFGFLITVRDDAGFKREQVTAFLEQRQIQTRTLFAGNIIRHPCFDGLRAEKRGYRTIGSLPNSDRVLEHTFMLGVYPGLTAGMLDYVVQSIHDFCQQA